MKCIQIIFLSLCFVGCSQAAKVETSYLTEKIVYQSKNILGFEKYRPDTFFINTQDRWLTTTGAEKAGQLVPDYIVKPSTRNETTTYQHGTPNAVLKTASYVPKQHEQSKRIQLEGFDVGHSTATRSAPLQHKAVDNNHNSHTNYENNRSINIQPQTFGSGFSKAIGSVIAPIMDILKPSRKEEYSCNMRIYGNMGGQVPENYVLTSGDVTNTTIKETTIYQPNGYINSQKDNAGYLVNEQIKLEHRINKVRKIVDIRKNQNLYLYQIVIMGKH